MPRLRTTIDPQAILRLLEAQPHSPRQLVKDLHLPKHKRQEVSKVLRQLYEDRKVIRLRGGAFGLPRAHALILGRLVQPQPGFAFVVPEQEGEEDLFIPASDLKDAMPDDKVAVRVVEAGARGLRRRAVVVDVVERAHRQIVGTFRKERSYGLLRPDGMPFVREFFIPAEAQLSAKDGEKVVARVTAWPEGYIQGRAEVVEVLGPEDAPGVDVAVIIRQNNLPDIFSQAAVEEARRIARDPGEAEIVGRLDLRDLPIVTIDGADARDFDDAVHCDELPNGGWRLGVHIADVSHYLREGSELDLEARNRGTSVYFPDRVLHMLPEELSTGVCSLVPHRDRLTVSAVMEIDPEGHIVRSAFHRSVIHSAARLTYDWVEDVLGQDPRESRDTPAWDFVPELKRLQAVARALRRRRQERGSLDFDLPDPRVVLGPDGRVQTIEKRVQKESPRLIEDCMSAANEAVATFLARTDTPSLYRIHEAPSGEKLEELREFLTAYGYLLPGTKPREASKVYQRLLASWQGKPEEPVLNMALLRSMKLAVYAPKNIGHFGLASRCYSHFTSPIRRYPDLIVHRMLTERLAGPVAGRRREMLAANMPTWGEELSIAERRAEKAEREAVRVKQVEFMEGRLGEIFGAVISNVTNFGFFVELQEHFIEGLVRAADIGDDYYRFEEGRRYLAGVNHGREFRTGQKVLVRASEIDKDEMRVLFMLHEERPRGQNPAKRNAPRLAPRSRRGKW